MIEPSVSAVLSSRYAIRRFYFIVVAATLLVILTLGLVHANFSATPLKEAVSLVLTTLAANLVAIMIMYAVWIFVMPLDERNAQITPIARGEIAERADALIEQTSEYWFLGRGGGFFRAKVLPRLDDIARTKRQRIRIRVVVPDPSFGRNALVYRDMIKGLGEPADEKTLGANVLATAVDLALKGGANPYLSIELVLSNLLPVVRYDVSTNGVLITRDQPRLPAIHCSAGNPFYETFRDAVENEIRQGTPIVWTAGANILSAETITVADLPQLFSGFPKIDEETLARGLDLLKKPGHRYD